MTEDELHRFLTALPGVAVVLAGEENGAPEVAWGDSFFYYDPRGDRRVDQLPFATIVLHDYPGFDTASYLDRAGVYRLNIAVGRRRFQELFGYPPAAHARSHPDLDYSVLDQVLPHPAYAAQAWASILNPGAGTGERARALLTEAHARAVDRHRRPR